MDSLGIPWYSTGTVDVTQGSSNVTGVGTNWLNAGLKKGDIFTLDKIRIYQVWDVESNTSLTLQEAFQGATGTAQVYFVIRNFAATMQAEIAAQVAELVNKYESYIDTELKQIVGPAGPTSFPYRGTWATGRSYNALDVVQYGTQLYMALYGHTSASTNAPDATGTAWTPLAVSLSGTVLNSFTNGSSVNPNGINGISIVGKNTNNDVTLSAAADAIRLQQTSGGTTTTLLQLPGTLNADIAALKTGKQDKGNYVVAEDTGWSSVNASETGAPVLLYRKKNGIVYLKTARAGFTERCSAVNYVLPKEYAPNAAFDQIAMTLGAGSPGQRALGIARAIIIPSASDVLVGISNEMVPFESGTTLFLNCSYLAP